MPSATVTAICSPSAAGSGGQVADPILLKVHSTAQINAAVRTAVAWGAEVITMSFGRTCNFECRNYGEDYDFRPARDDGVVLVAAAGNDTADVLEPNFVHPCIEDDVICVGALEPGTKVAASFSNFGGGVDLFAPTDFTVMPTNDPKTKRGICRSLPPDTTAGPLDCLHRAGRTSASAPYVAGVVAMMRSVNPAMPPAQVRDTLVGVAWTDSPDPLLTRYLNAFAAVRSAGGGALRTDPHEPDPLGTPTGGYLPVR